MFSKQRLVKAMTLVLLTPGGLRESMLSRSPSRIIAADIMKVSWQKCRKTLLGYNKVRGAVFSVGYDM